jgi:hypothetical protein
MMMMTMMTMMMVQECMVSLKNKKVFPVFS